ncbi:MAG TPA: hypothetical protein DDW52_26120 [Planctomycetaceae bacterium]|nr:hypothetical protein [Planctomycetaceae bacterium]
MNVHRKLRVSALISVTPGILVKSSRTETAQDAQCMFGTLRLTKVAASLSALSTDCDVAGPELVGVAGSEHPARPTKPIKHTVVLRFMAKLLTRSNARHTPRNKLTLTTKQNSRLLADSTSGKTARKPRKTPVSGLMAVNWARRPTGSSSVDA